MNTNLTNTEFDLIIVGAGPAGASAAIYAKRHGLKTLLIDKQSFPRDKICGDALSGKSIWALRDMELLEQVSNLPHAGINRVSFSGPNHDWFDVDLQGSPGIKQKIKGFVIRRKYLDNFMFEQARVAANKTLTDFTVTDVISENGCLVGIKGQQKGSDSIIEYRSKIILAADGFNSVISRKTGLYEHDPAHGIVALRCYYKNVADLTDQIELHFIDEVIPGYFWIFPLEENYANVGIGMLHKYIKKEKVDLKLALQHAIASDFFKDRFRDAEPMEEPVGWNLPVGSKHRKIYGNGFMLLGDAAGLIDPFTGEGIGNAMFSARYAVETARKAIDKNDFSENMLANYDANLWKSIGHELKVSSKLQWLGRHRSLLNFVIRKAANSPEVSDLVSGMVANQIPREKLANPLFYLKLLFS